jgi:conjugative relaxase-like TrwC/TraI family protein
VEEDGSRWVRATELERCTRARDGGVDPGEIRALGAPNDQLTLADAAQLVGLTKQYLRGLARYYDDHRDEIEQSLAAGRHPRRAFLVADRGTKGRWLVARDRLAEFLERRRPPAVRVGYDLTLTTEKSLGVLALLGDTATRDAVLESIQAGNDWALGWLEDHAAVGRVDGHQVQGEGWIVASFRHLTSRALDPFPHHHNVIANSARLPDGTHRALDARALYQDARAASALATAEMRHQLSSQLGVGWRPGRSAGWEIDGITNEVVREFSQRRNEIDEALQELETEIGRGAHPNEIEHIVLRTRPAKNHTPADDLVASWRDRAACHGLTTDALAALTGHQATEQTVHAEALFASLAGPNGICAGGSVFSRSDALAAMVNHPVPTHDGEDAQPLLCGAQQLLELTDCFVASRHVVALTNTVEPLYTTVEMLDVQDRIATRFTKGLHRGAHLVTDTHIDVALSRHAHLTAEQRQLVSEWCQRGHRFQTAIGRAGAGKTTTVAACADAWTAAGYRVLGAAVKGEATRTLAATTGIECETVAWYLAHTDPHNLPLDARTILVIDEASTLADRDLDALMTMAANTGASLRLIGDPAQHGAIAAGGMFRVLCEQHPRHTPELTTTHRLHNPHDRAAAQALREGRIDEAFDQLAAAGHLHVVSDDLAMYRHVLGRWWDAHCQGLDHPMVDQRNSTRRQLNRLAHLLRQVHGELGDQEIAASGNRNFAVGDRVTARAPNRQLHVHGDAHAYVRNGALGTIIAVRADRHSRTNDTLTVDFDGIGRIDIPRPFFDHHRTPAGRPEVGIDHAYALTSYAVQGSTRDVSTSRVDATATRAETYVDITRGRHENHLYLTAATDPLDGEALPRIPPAPADVAVAERLHRSTGELTAWELTHPADEAASVGQAVGI